VLRADVSLGPDNRSRGYGTVLLATAEDAGRAIDMFNGYEWQSRILEVRVDRIGGPMPLPSEPGMQGMAMQASMMPPGVSMMTSNNLYLNNSPQASRGSILSPAPPFGSHQQTPSTYALQNQQTSSQSHQIFSPQPQTLSLSQLHLHAQLQAPSQFEQLQQQYQGQQQQQQPPSIPGRTLFVGNVRAFLVFTPMLSHHPLSLTPHSRSSMTVY
jgi:RNA recognition motif-containing protein